MPAGRAYLPVPTALATDSALTVVFNDQAIDAINTINKDIVKTNSQYWYSINGEKVLKPRHGVYIRNGKKYIVK